MNISNSIIIKSKDIVKTSNNTKEKQYSKWASLRSLLQSKSSLQSSVNFLRKTTIEKFQTECHRIYKKKLKILQIAYSNSQIVQTITNSPHKPFPPIKIKDGCSELTYSEEICTFMFEFRSNNYLMMTLIECLSSNEINILVPFLCHFFYENLYSQSTEQEEILYIIYLLLEKEVDRLTTPSLNSFLQENFLSKFLQEFSNRNEIKSYINKVVNPIIQKLENVNSTYYSLDFNQNKNNEDEFFSNAFVRHSAPLFNKNNSEFKTGSIEMKKIDVFSTETYVHLTQKVLKNCKDPIEALIKENNVNYTLVELRKFFEKESDPILKAFYLKQLKFIHYSKNKNIYTFDSKENSSKDKEEILLFIAGIQMVKSFINELLDNLQNDVIIPYSIKCICKLISILISNKFKDISTIQKTNFICEYFFNFLIFPVLLNPDIGECNSSVLISLETRRNLINISIVLKRIIRTEFFTNTGQGTFTIFNDFIKECLPKILKFTNKVINTRLPSKIDKLSQLFYEEDAFILDNALKDPKLINYDYFEENSSDFLKHQSICFSLREFILFIKIVNDNKKKFDFLNRNFINAFNKLKDFISLFESLEEEKAYYVIINDKFTPETEKLLSVKETKLPLKSIPQQSYVNEIKYCISFILSKMDFRPHSEWVIENIKTPACFDIIYEIIKNSSIDETKNDIPLSCYGAYIKTNLKLLPMDYTCNDYELLYKEILEETKSKINFLKKLNDFLTIQMTSKFECLKQKIKIIKNELYNIREAEMKIKLVKFIHTEKIHSGLSLPPPNGPLTFHPPNYYKLLLETKSFPPQYEIKEFMTINDFIKGFSRIEQLYQEIKEDIKYKQMKGGDVLIEYIDSAKELIQDNPLFQNVHCKDREKYIDRVCDELKNYILHKILSLRYQEDYIIEDKEFFQLCNHLKWIDPVKHLNFPERVYNKALSEFVKEHIALMDIIQNPDRKLSEFSLVIKNICNMFTFTVNKSTSEHSDIFPMIIYAFIAAQPRHLIYSIRIIKYFMTEKEMNSIKGSYITEAESAINYIKTHFKELYDKHKIPISNH